MSQSHKDVAATIRAILQQATPKELSPMEAQLIKDCRAVAAMNSEHADSVAQFAGILRENLEKDFRKPPALRLVVSNDNGGE